MPRWPSQPSPSPAQHALLCALRDMPGVAVRAVADRLGRYERNVDEMIRVLVREGFVAKEPRKHRTTQLTEKGLGAANAPCPVAPPPKRDRPDKRGAPKGRARKPPPVSVAPPRPLPRSDGSAPVPTPGLPALPASVASFRGLRHPPIPQAHGKPVGMRSDTWAAMTTIKIGAESWRFAS